MDNKIFGRFLIHKTILGLIAYLVIASLGVFTIKFVYTLIFSLLGFSVIFLDTFIWIIIAMLLSQIANRVVLLFKIENTKIFSLLTMTTSLWLVYVYYYATVAGNLIAYGYFLPPFEFGNVLKAFVSFFSEGISISRRLTSGVSLPSFLNYIFAIIVTISFLIPKGSFLFKKGIYIEGDKVQFNKYYLYSKSKIDDATLKSESEIFILDEQDINDNSFLDGEYYTLYVSNDHSNRVYQLIRNTVTKSKKEFKLNILDTV